MSSYYYWSNCSSQSFKVHFNFSGVDLGFEYSCKTIMTWILHRWTSSALKPHTFRAKSRRWEQFWFDFRLSGLLGSSWETVTGFRCVDNALRWEIWMKTGRLRLHCTSAPVFVSCFFLFCFFVCWMTSKRSSLGPSRSEPFGICSHYYSLCLCQAEQQRRTRERER